MRHTGHGYLHQPVSRRSVLGFLAGAAGAVVVGAVRGGNATARLFGPATAISPEARMHIAQMVALIQRGRARRLSNGTVVVAGWYVPKRYVSVMKAMSEQSRRV